MAEIKEKLKKYGKSMDGNFEVIDTIGVPHPYCITPKHLRGDRMYLDEDAIREAEEKFGATCDICKKISRKTGKPILSYDEHETALLIACYVKEEELGKNHELHEFLLEIKDMSIEDKYAGFAFLDRSSGSVNKKWLAKDKGGKNDKSKNDNAKPANI